MWLRANGALGMVTGLGTRCSVLRDGGMAGTRSCFSFGVDPSPAGYDDGDGDGEGAGRGGYVSWCFVLFCPTRLQIAMTETVREDVSPTRPNSASCTTRTQAAMAARMEA
eukprot:scaffold16050_cov121-Isochrysis_galbana.AAC.1